MPDDEKQLTGVETQEQKEKQGIAQQEAAETPEEKEQREFKENIETLKIKLEEFLVTRKIKELSENIPSNLEQEVSLEPPKVRNLESMKEEMAGQQRTLKDLREGLKKLSLRMSGIKNPSELLPLVYYLENYLVDEESKHIELKPSEEEKVLEKYRKKGYTVEDSSYARDKRKKGFDIKRSNPYAVEPRELKQLPGLLQQNNDPIEIIEHLRNIGFDIDAHTIKYQLDFLKTFVADPQIKEVLVQLDVIGVKGDFPRYFGDREGDPAQRIVEFARNPESRSLLNDETVKRIINFEKAVGRPLEVDNLKNIEYICKLFSQESPTEFINFFVQRINKEDSEYARREILNEALSSQEEGLVPEFTSLLQKDPWLASIVYDAIKNYSWHEGYSSRYFTTKELKAVTSSESITSLMNDENLRNVTKALQALYKDYDIEKRYFDNLVGIAGQLSQFPEVPALLEVYRELNIPLGSLMYSGTIKEMVEILQNKAGLAAIVKPEFLSFVHTLEEKLEYKIALKDIQVFAIHEGSQYSQQWLAKLFNNENFRKGLDSSEFVGFIKSTDQFDGMTKSNYGVEWFEALANIPDAPQKAKKLYDLYGYRLSGFNNELGAFIHAFSPSGPQERLFEEKTVQYFEKLQKTVQYKFNLNEGNELIDQSESEGLNKLLADRTVQKIINKAFVRPLRLEDLRQITLIEPLYYDLVLTLKKQLDVVVSYNMIEELPFIYEHQRVFLPTARKLKEYGFTFNVIVYAKSIQTIGEQGLVDVFAHCKDNMRMQQFFLDHLKELAVMPKEKIPTYLEIIKKIEGSPSQEIQRLRPQLLEQIIKTPDPLSAYNQIEEVFIKNNLPTVGKVFKIFQILYPPNVIKKTLRKGSPVLTQATSKRQEYIIYQDLLRTHIESANRSLRQYIEVLLEGKDILELADQKGTDNLDERQQNKLKYCFDKITTLFINSTLGKHVTDEGVKTNSSLQDRYGQLRTSLSVREGQKVTDRIAEMFLKPLGFNNLEEVLERMRQEKQESHERGLALVQNNEINLKQGDLLKGVNTDYISNILQNGSVAKEFLGASAGSDSTPFDTDVSMVLPQDVEQGFEETIKNSLAREYGRLLFAVKDRGQFQHTTKEQSVKRDPQKLELFPTGGGRHYGIRTGFPTTEIDFMVAQDSLISEKEGSTLEKIFYEIAQNGYYIPVTTKKSELIFTPQMYEEYRRTFDGLDRFDGAPFNFIPSNSEIFYGKQINEIVREKENDEVKISQAAQTIRRLVSQTLKEAGVELKEEFDSTILGAELFDIGSTGRRTNLPGDYDFDFILKLDSKDFLRAQELAGLIRNKLSIQKEGSHSEANGYYQFRALGVSEISGQPLEKPLDIDIGFASKSELSVFGSHDAIQEKLQWIEKHIGRETREQVTANIVLCKRLLKQANAYKKFEEGGLGGVGTENWILAHSGNIKEAFQSFHDAAYENGARVPFEKFKEKYRVLDAGVNVKQSTHDNYIERNLKLEAYAKMLDVIDGFLEQASKTT